MIRVHHINCGTMCPVGGKLLPSVFPERVVCHCLLVEAGERLVLIDTGLGTADVERPSRLGLTRFGLGFVPDPAGTAVQRIRDLGLDPEDVTDLVPTHLDLDHAGGISDFPNARVHVAQRELDAALARNGMNAAMRYRSEQLSGDIDWRPFEASSGERWEGFDCVRELEGLPPEMLLVSLPGHSAGHYGVAVRAGDETLLHVGDAYYDRRELTVGETKLGLRLFQRSVHEDPARAAETRAQLSELLDRPALRVLSSHDPAELDDALAS